MTSPVTKPASGEHRNAIDPAISSAVPKRRNGVLSSNCAPFWPIRSCVMDVAMMPGATAFTRICGASSSARLRVKLCTAPLDAE
ncbi:hypothetical protein G6F22_021763 [Rhizopus arrhizus]|nr:hypothetical protein G6F22_021763 [Rhizopus arrhizus]